MRSKIFLIIVILFVFLACHVAKVWLARVGSTDAAKSETARQEHPRRIVSMAPSVTEILFALGLGERVVGVSNFCNYPAEAAKIDRIGGIMNPNLEAIVALESDLVVMLHGNKAIFPGPCPGRTRRSPRHSCRGTNEPRFPTDCSGFRRVHAYRTPRPGRGARESSVCQ